MQGEDSWESLCPACCEEHEAELTVDGDGEIPETGAKVVLRKQFLIHTHTVRFRRGAAQSRGA